MNDSRQSRTWYCGAFEFPLDGPLVMGIVNVTPDSFSDGGDFAESQAAIGHGRDLAIEGAAILDVGGESTRPGSEEVSIETEAERVLPVISALAARGHAVSIDTRHPQVARAALDAGASIVNDVAGFRDPSMVELVATSGCGVVIMHMLGEPKTMQDEPHYEDVVAEVSDYLAEQADMLIAAGVARDRIAIDPGIGFGKTLEHNLQLLAGITALAALGYPVLIGASRKRFIGELTGVVEPKERLGGSVAVAVESVRRGASIVRVHDVAPTVQALIVAGAIERR